jgi:KipI family sensor histidine kinase inhibitor
MGERAVLLEVGSLGAAVALHRRLDAGRIPGVLDLVPAARTVLVRIDPSRLSLRGAEDWVRSVPLGKENPDAGPHVTIPVRYDGPDLAATAEALGMTSDELVSRHSLAEWRCAFIGFAPGFAYLAGTVPGGGLDVPRRATSRDAVPAGSVGLAGEFTGIYPRSSPGGWQLIGTTDAVLWDVDREPPALIAPGTIVRFEVVEP